MFNSSFRHKRLAGGHIEFGEDIVSEAGSDSGGTSLHDRSKNDKKHVSDYNTEPSIIPTTSSSFNRRNL